MNDEAEPKAEKAGKADKAAKGPMLTRKTLVERVQAKAGAKAKDVKKIIEATLEVMAEAVKSGEGLRLPPFGVGKPRAAAEGGADGKAAKTVMKTSTKPPKAPKPKAPKADKAPRAAKADRPEKAARAGKGAGRKKANEALATADASE